SPSIRPALPWINRYHDTSSLDLLQRNIDLDRAISTRLCIQSGLNAQPGGSGTVKLAFRRPSQPSVVTTAVDVVLSRRTAWHFESVSPQLACGSPKPRR